MLRHCVGREIIEAELAGKIQLVMAVRAIALHQLPSFLLAEVAAPQDDSRCNGDGPCGPCPYEGSSRHALPILDRKLLRRRSIPESEYYILVKAHINPV